MEIGNELGFYSVVSRVLQQSESLDSALSDLVRQAVPALADACAIQVLDAGQSVESLTVARPGPEADDRVSVAQWRTPEGMRREPAYSALLEELPAGSCLVLPLASRGRSLGSIAFAVSNPGGFAPEQIRMAEEFCRGVSDGVARCHAAQAAPAARATPEGRDAIRIQALQDRDAFRAELGDALRDLLDPAAVRAETTRLAGERLGASRAYYCAYAPGEGRGTFVMEDSWCRPGLPGLSGRYDAATYGGPFLGDLLAGRPAAISDSSADIRLGEAHRAAFDAAGLRASLVVPLLKEGALVAVMGVGQEAPRDWTRDDIRLLEQAAERAWAAMERARAEAEAGRTRDLLQATFAAIPDVLSVIGTDGKILFANEAAVRATNFASLEEYLAADIREIRSRVEVEDERGRRVAPTDTPAATALRTGEDVTRLLRVRDPASGAIRWMESKAACVRDGDGTLRNVVVCARDVTRLKAAQDALAAQEQRLRLALDVGHVGVWELDVRTDRVSWTERMCAMHGLAPGQHPRGQAEFLALVHPDDRQKAMAAFLAAESRKRIELEYRVPGRHGEVRWIHTAGGYQIDAGGSSRRIIGAAIEITERKRAEDAALKMQERVRQAQNLEAIGRMAGGMSHDFNNLLTAINGYADLILQSVREDQVLRDYASSIIESGTRAVAITQTLLAYSRRQLLATEVADANGILRNLHDLVRKLAPENVAVIVSPSPAPEPVRVDVGKLKQAVMQVVMNALDAMPRGGRMTLSACSSRLREPVEAVETPVPPGRYVILEVADTGTGIDPDVLERIFDPYFTTKKLGGKSGLGLSLVQGVVRQHGGFIQVLTRVGSGTRFRMYLPPAAAQSPAPSHA